MKITIKINGAEVLLEAQKPEEVVALGPLVLNIVEGASINLPKRTRKAVAETGVDSELAQSRLQTIDWVLSTNQKPMNAPEIAAEIKDNPDFYTKSGDPVHIVRRALVEGVANGMIKKTANGLFTTPMVAFPPSVNPTHRGSYVAPSNDDLDDPFADN